MNYSNRAIVLLLLACSPACGRQVVHFLDDAGSDAEANSGGGGAGHGGGGGSAGHAGGAGGAGHGGGGIGGVAGIGGVGGVGGVRGTGGAGGAAGVGGVGGVRGTGGIGGAGGGAGIGGLGGVGGLGGLGGVGPLVLSTLPVDHGINVPLNPFLSATFNEAMDSTTFSKTTFTLNQGATNIDGAVTYDPVTMTVTFAPTVALSANLVYTASLSTAIKDALGRPLAAIYTWTFTAAPDVLPPQVMATSPTNLAINVSSNVKPAATFSEAMDPATLNGLTVTVAQGLTPVLGTLLLDGLTNTLTFTPGAPLALGLVYTVTISTGAMDLGGRALGAPYSWSFTTGACGQMTVDLQSAGAFAVLAGSTVTNGGPTMIAGDLGVSPGSAVTGFPPGIVVGLQHVTDTTAAQGIADLLTAYNDAKGRTLCPVLVAGNLGSLTLTPGLYMSTSSLEISSGDLTLDAQGDSTAVFIFQMASTLTTTVGRQVILSNGALAANVFWQVGTSATLGATSIFDGTIMADQTITLNSGATLNGRALARIGAVNLASDTVVLP